ncbi:MAG TPA: deoxyribodipyrimidine photo-lyase [Flavobacteriia bacterium]|nr:deoxyribodipyrimidine photo-lyase [Flavobacteriia bacterium]
MIKEALTIFWFRRDLRLEDNHALFLALQNKNVKPIFIFDTTILKKLDVDDARVSFIYKQLARLHKILKKYKSGIKIYYGNPIEIWKKIIYEHTINQVFANEDYEPYAIKRDVEIHKILQSKQISFTLVKDQVIFAKDAILKSNGLPYTVYSPYKKVWLANFNKQLIKAYPSASYLNNLCIFESEFPALKSIGFLPSKIKVKPINTNSLENYDKLRDFPARNSGSNASVHLRFGTVSIRKLVKLAIAKNEVWLSELIWREFFTQILYHFPKVVTHSFKPKYDRIPWLNNMDLFHAWCQGKTGYLLVDAGMRELNKTGYMHNRARMICASFLCKDLLIDWRLGEDYFAKKLLDFDLASNNGNWQWAAGTGCDAAPYFRIFNPITQQKKFDKNLDYIKKWIPNYDADSYPKPIIEHSYARKRCLAHYKKYLNE